MGESGTPSLCRVDDDTGVSRVTLPPAYTREVATIALTNALLIDGTSDSPLPGATVLMEGSRLGQVGRDVAVPVDAQVIDLHGQTVMPGLMDAHVHLTMDALCGQSVVWHHLSTHPTLIAFHELANAQMALNAGFTTLRNMQVGGHHIGGDVALRDAIKAGLVLGPRIIPSAMIFGMTGGHNDMFVPAAFKDRWSTADGPDECRKAVRMAIREGAEFIKIFTTGNHSYPVQVDSLNYTQAEIEAICQEAAAAGRRVAAHASSAAGIKNAIRGGVATIEHGTRLDDEAIQLMVDHGTYLVPTLSIISSSAMSGTWQPLSEGMQVPPEITAKRRARFEEHLDGVRRAYQAGVKIVLGTDASDYAPFGRNGLELELMVQAGLSPMDAIRAGTSVAAESFGIGHATGSIESGKLADVLIIDGDPTLDVRLLQDVQRIKRVYMAGQLVVERDKGVDAYTPRPRWEEMLTPTFESLTNGAVGRDSRAASLLPR
jgi:imidazolonepropionase-like amidohydrolase